MIVRPYYLDILKTYRDVPLVKILAGIRRCGKSTILDMLKDDLLGSGIFADHVIHLRYTSEELDDSMTGLVHVSQISHTRIKDPSVVLKVGDEVKVKVIAIKDGKLSLSIKALAEDKAAAEEEEIRNIKLPKSEELTTNLGELFKNLKL